MKFDIVNLPPLPTPPRCELKITLSYKEVLALAAIHGASVSGKDNPLADTLRPFYSKLHELLYCSDSFGNPCDNANKISDLRRHIYRPFAVKYSDQ